MLIVLYTDIQSDFLIQNYAYPIWQHATTHIYLQSQVLHEEILIYPPPEHVQDNQLQRYTFENLAGFKKKRVGCHCCIIRSAVMYIKEKNVVW